MNYEERVAAARGLIAFAVSKSLDECVFLWAATSGCLALLQLATDVFGNVPGPVRVSAAPEMLVGLCESVAPIDVIDAVADQPSLLDDCRRRGFETLLCGVSQAEQGRVPPIARFGDVWWVYPMWCWDGLDLERYLKECELPHVNGGAFPNLWLRAGADPVLARLEDLGYLG